jgi:hypothetical protein
MIKILTGTLFKELVASLRKPPVIFNLLWNPDDSENCSGNLL